MLSRRITNFLISKNRGVVYFLVLIIVMFHEKYAVLRL